MQFKIFPAIILFLGSYFPLSLILVLQDIDKASWGEPICRNLSALGTTCHFPFSNPVRSISFFAVCLVSLIFFLTVFKAISGEHELEIEESKTIPNDLINYVFPYVVSFMGLDIGDSGKFYGFLVFLVWLFLITYKSGQILMNPVLLAFGWRLYEIKAKIKGHQRVLRALSRDQVVSGERLKSCLVQDVYVLSKEIGEQK